jgi:hypothetical protein
VVTIITAVVATAAVAGGRDDDGNIASLLPVAGTSAQELCWSVQPLHQICYLSWATWRTINNETGLNLQIERPMVSCSRPTLLLVSGVLLKFLPGACVWCGGYEASN